MSNYKIFENKMTIEEAVEEFDFFNEGDYITRKMEKAKDIVLKELQEVKSDLYEANNRINDLLEVMINKKWEDKINKRITELQDNKSNKTYILSDAELKNEIIRELQKLLKDREV